MKPALVVLVLSLNLACSFALKAPPTAATATRITASYGSSLMHFGEFDVKGIVEKSVGVGVVFSRGRAALEQRSVHFTVTRSGKPFAQLTCAAAPSEPKLKMGSLSLNHPKYTLECTGDDFTFAMTGDPEKPLAGVVTYRGVRYPVKTSADTADKGSSPHLGFHVESDEGWLASADIQGPTWLSTRLSPESREAVVLANFAWASRRNVMLEGVDTGFMVKR
ncbi:MAG: hypothetical protein IAE78_03375 [Myxococcus sp.]|nr:hypothetical protein [Myxococcus sp.]